MHCLLWTWPANKEWGLKRWSNEQVFICCHLVATLRKCEVTEQKSASVHAETNPRMHYGLYFSCYFPPYLFKITYLFMIWSVILRLEYRTEWNPDKLELADNSRPYGDHVSPADLQHLGDRPDLLVEVGGKRSRKTWSELTKQMLPVGFPGLMMHRALGLQCVRASSTARCSSLMSRLQHFSSFR